MGNFLLIRKKWEKWALPTKIQLIFAAIALGIAIITLFKDDQPYEDEKEDEGIVVHELTEIANPEGNASVINGDSTKVGSAVFQSGESDLEEKKQPIEKPQGLQTFRSPPTSFKDGFPVETLTITNYYEYPIILTTVVIDIVRFDFLLKSGQTGEILPSVENRVELKPSKGKYALPLKAPINIMPNESWSSMMLFYTQFDSLQLRPQEFGTYGFTVTFMSNVEGIKTESISINY